MDAYGRSEVSMERESELTSKVQARYTIEKAIEDQATTIEALSDVVERFVRRLTPVLSPEENAQTAASYTPTRDDTSVIFTRIVANTDRLNMLGKALSETIQRINLD